MNKMYTAVNRKYVVAFLLSVVFAFAGLQSIKAQTYFSESFEGAWYLNGNSSTAATAAGPNAPSTWTQTRVLNNVAPGGGSTSSGAQDWAQASNTSGNTYAGTTTPYSASATYSSSYTFGAPPNGTKVLWFKDGATSTGNTRRMESPAFSLSTSTSPTISFSYVYPGSGVVLLVGSNDGGASWGTIATLPTGTSTSAWTTQIISIPATYKVSNAKIGFQIAASYGSYDVFIDNVVVGEYCVAPGNQATALTNGTNTSTTIPYSFTAASSSPSGYLVVSYPTGAAVTAPVNGTTYTAAQALGLGTVVAVGATASGTVTGLIPSTAYDIYVYDYNNTPCIGLAYNTTTPLKNTFTTSAATTYTWIGGTTGTWGTAGNWSPSRSSVSSYDILKFDGSNINGSSGTGAITVTAMPATETFGQLILTNSANVTLQASANASALTINGGVGTDINVPSGSTLSLTGTSTYTLGVTHTSGAGNTVSIAGTLNIANTGAGTGTITFNTTNATTTVSGTLNNGSSTATGTITGASTSTLTVSGTYNHTGNGGTVPTATYSVGSSVNITGIVAATTITMPTTIGGNFTWNSTGQTGNVSPTAFAVTGTSTISSTGTGTGSVIAPTAVTISFNGGLTLSGSSKITHTATTATAIINASSFTQSGTSSITGSSTGTLNINVTGTFNQSAGTISQSSTGKIAINFTGTSSQSVTLSGTNTTGIINYTVNNGSGNGISLTGTISINNGATFTSSIAGTAVTGGTVTYNTTASTLAYVTAQGAQTAGSEWPSSNPPLSVTINNTSSTPNNVITLGGSRTISNGVTAGTLTLTAGYLDIGANTLTLGTSATNLGVLTATNGLVRMSTGTFTRFFGTTGLPTAAATTGIGVYPIANGTNNRTISVYFSAATALTTGGSISLTHTDATGSSAVSFTDASGSYAVAKRTNTYWAFTTSGVVASGTIGIKATAGSVSSLAATATSNTALRLIQNAGAVGTFAATSYTSPSFFLTRTAMTVTNLANNFYIGGSTSDIPVVYTSIANGDWSQSGTWDANGVPPDNTATVIINSNVTVTTTQPCSNVTVNSGYTLTANTGAALTTTTTIANSGTITVNAGTITSTTTTTNSGTINVSGGTFTCTTSLTNNAGATLTVSSGTLNIANTFTNTGTFNANGGTTNVATSGATAYTLTNTVTTGAFNVAGGTVNLGVTNNTYCNRSFANNGTLTVSTGTLNVFGNIASGASSVFNQSGGNINIDGNAGGVAANSVASGVYLLSFSQASTGINLTGGTLTIVDPHANSTSTYSIYYTNGTTSANSITSAHTTQFGNGVSTDAGGNAVGFYIDNWASSAILTFGNIVVNGPTGTNRSVTSIYQLYANGNVTVNSGGTLNVATLTFGGNLSVNSGGTFINTTSSNTGIVSIAETLGASTLTQSIGGAGTIQNLASSPTANFAALTINNTNATGVTLNSPLSVSGTLTMTSGIINTSATNLLTLGTTTAAGTLSGTPSATNMIVGPFARTFAASVTGTAGTTLFPVGKGSIYKPIYIDATTTAGGAVTISGESFASNSGTAGTGVSSLSAARYEVLTTSGFANLTSAYIKSTDASITSNNVFVQSASAAGTYNNMSGVTSTYAATPTLTSSAIAAATLTSSAYLAFANYTISTISDNSPQIGSNPISPAATFVPLQTIQLTENKANTLNSISFVLSGGSSSADYYTSTDIASGGFKLWYSTTATAPTFASATPIATASSSRTSAGGDETITFSGLTQSLASGSGNYFWITANFAGVGTAVTGHLIYAKSIDASASTAPFAVASGGISGTATAGGVQTISLSCDASLTSVTAGTISAIASSICPNGSTTLSLVGATNATGLTYNWHSSTDNFVSSDNAGVSTTTTLSTGSLASTMYYKCVVSCVAGSATGITPVVTETVYNTAVTITPSTTGGTPATQYCGYTNAPVQLVASAGTAPDSYTWNTNRTGLYTNNPATTAYTSGTNAATVYAAPAANQTYTVTANYTTIGCTATTQTQAVTVGTKVTVTSVSATATTLCPTNTSTLSATVTPLSGNKLQEDFESGLPATWTFINNNASTGNGWVSSSTYAKSGTKSISCSYGTGTNDAWAITPAIALTSGTQYTVRYYYRTYSASYPENLKVTVGTTNTVAGQSTVLTSGTLTATASFTLQSATYTPGASGNYYFGFNDYSPSADWTLYIDSITIIGPAPSLVYNWSPSTNFASGSTASSTSPVFQMPNPAVSSTINFTATEPGGCAFTTTASTTPASVTINASTAPLDAGTITSTISTGGSVCPASSPVLTANPSGGCGAYSYAWYFNNGTSNVAIAGATSKTYTITNIAAATAGTYSVLVTDQTSPTPATSTSAGFVINLYNTTPTITATVAGTASSLYCGYTNKPVQLVASTGVSGVSYTWNTNLTGLYTNNPATTSYISGTNAATVYAAPTAQQTYTVTANFAGATGGIASCAAATNTKIVTYNKVTINSINSYTLCQGTTATLTSNVSAVSGGTPFTYSWAPNDGNLSDVTIASPDFTMPKDATSSYTYSLTVTETGGCSATASTTENINTTPLSLGAITGFTSGNSVCANTGTITLTANAAGGCEPYTYQWYKGSTTVGTNALTYTVNTSTVSNAGTYSVVVTDNFGNSLTSANMVVNITDNTFSLSPSTAQTFCSGSAALNITATANGAGSYTWAWTSSPAGFTATSNAISVTPTATTTYSVKATVGSCQSALQTVTVTYAPGVATVSAAASTPSVCAGNTFGLTGSATGVSYNTPSTYTEGFEGTGTVGTTIPTNWTFINAGTGNAWTNISYGSAHSGTAAMECLYNSSNAANAWAFSQGLNLIAGQPYTITFWYNNNASFAEKLQVTVGSATTVAGQTVQLWNNGSSTAAGGGTGGAATTFNTGGTYTQGTATYTPTTSGTYYFAFNCYSAKNKDYVDIDDISIQYTTTTTSSISSYTWSSSPAGFTSSSQNPTGVALQQSAGSDVSTSYYVTATNNFGCTATSTAATVNPGGGTPSASIGFTTGSSSVCTGSPVTLHASVSGGCSPFTYAWTLNGTTVGTNSADLVISSAAAANGGTYAVTVTDNFSQVSNTPTQSLTVYPVNSVTVTPSATGRCGASSAAVSLVASGGTSYTWLPITGLFTNSGATTAYTTGTDAATVYNKVSSSQTYTVTSTDANGCTITGTQSIGYYNFTPSVTVSALPTSVCEGSTSTLTASGMETLPMVNEDFEGSFPTAGWTFLNAGTGNAWATTTTMYNGSNAIYVPYNGTKASNAWAFTPALSLTSGKQYSVRFYYRIGSTTWTEQLKVTAGTSNTVAAQTTTLWNNGSATTAGGGSGTGGTGLNTQSSYTLGTATFTAPTTGTYYFAWNCYSIANQDGLFLDSVTISASGAYTYAWTPSTNLSSSNGSSTTFTMPATGSPFTYNVNATETTSGCIATAATPATITLVSGAPTLSSLTASSSSVCLSTGGSSKLKVTISGGCAPYTYAWSNGTTTFTTNSNSNAVTDSVTVTPTVTTTYSVTITDHNGAVINTGNTVTVTVLNATPASVTSASRCGTGTVGLTATPSGSDNIVWYDAATAGNYLASGNSYTTPSISATTTYYAAASSGGTVATGGKPSTDGADGTNTTGGIYFTANTTFTLNSVVMYPTAAGTNTIVLYSGSTTSGTPLQTATYTFTGANTSGVTVPINWVIAPGTYTIYQSVGNAACYRDYSVSLPATVYPYNVGTAATLTGGSLSGYYYFFYNWSISTGCIGNTRTPVVATVTTPATITIANNSQIAAQSIATNSTNNVISQGKFTVGASNNGSLASIAAVLSASATYANADIASNGIKLWVGTSNVFAAATQYGADITSARTTGAAQTLTFSSTQSLVSGSTYYFWLTADITSGATLGNTIIVNSLTSSSFTFGGSSCNATPTGTISASGTTTIVSPCSSVVALTFASNSLSACTGATAPTFTGINTNSTSQAGYTYQWYSCDDAAGTNPVAVFGATGVNYTPANYTTAGTYYYFNTASCSYGSVSSNSAIITVVVTATPSITVGASVASICNNGQSSTLTITGAAASYSWSPSTGLSATTGSSVVATPTVTTTYSVTGTNGSCNSTAATTTITVNATPTAVTATPSTTSVCAGTTITLNGSATSNVYTPSTYSQTFESGVVTSGTVVPTGWTFINNGTGPNQWIASTTAHLGSGAMQYSWNGSNAADAWAITHGMYLVAGQSYTVSFWYRIASATYPEKLKVTVGNLATVAGQTTTIWNNGSATANGGGSGTGGSSIASQVTYAQATATYTAPTSGTYFFGWNCYSDANMDFVYVDDISIDYAVPGPISSWSWTSTHGYTSTSQNPTGVTPTNGVTYTLTASNANGCSATATTSAITVNPIPAAPTATNNGTSVCGTPNFTASSNSGAGSPVYAWYSAASGGTAIANQSASSYAPGSFAVGANTVYVTEVGTGNCESTPRVSSTITASTPPTHSLTAHAVTVCVNGSTDLSVSSSTYGNYDTYTWSPATNLYTDAGLTQAYQLGDNIASVYVKPTAAGHIVYTVYASGAQAGSDGSCTNSDTVRVTGQAVPSITVQPVAVTGCGTVSKTLSVSASSTGTLNYQWQMSLNGTNGSFSNVANGTPTGVTYTGGTASTLNIGSINAPYYYQVLVGDGICSSVTSSIVLVTAGTPTVTASAGASSCAAVLPVTESLTASASTGASLAWYAASTGGTALATGSTYAASVSSTTTYYAEAYTGGGTTTVGPASPTAQGGTTGTQTIAWDIEFTTLAATTLQSVTIYPLTSGQSGVIQILSGSGTGGSNLTTVNYTTTVSGGTTPQVIPINYTIATPGAYTLYTSILPSSGITRNTTLASYPYTSSVANITGNGYSAAYYMGIYNWTFGSNCVSNSRTAVTATVVNAPTISVASVTPICTGSSASLAVSSSNTNYTYTWTYGDSSTVLSGANQTVSPAGSRYYKVTATDNTTGNTYSGCSITGGVNVVVGQTPATLSASVSPSIFCSGGSAIQTATGGTTANMYIQSDAFEMVSPAFTTTGTGLTASINSTYYNTGTKSVLLAYTNSLTQGATSTVGYQSTANIDLSKYSAATLTFKHICATEAAADYGYVEYSTDGGTTWTKFPTTSYSGSADQTIFNGGNNRFSSASYTAWSSVLTTNTAVPTNSMWKTETFTVPTAAINLNTTTFKIRFRVGSSASTTYYGWLIDDVELTGNAKTTWSWTSTGAFTSALQNPTPTPSASTRYYVQATNSFGCTSNQATDTVTVLAASTQGTPTASSTTICNDGSSSNITLSQTGGALGTGAYWVWYTSGTYSLASRIDSTYSNDASLVISSPTTTTIYYLRAEGNQAPCNNTSGSSVTVTVNQPSIAATAVNASSTSICRGTGITLTQTGGSLGTGASWKWYSDNTFTTLVGTGSGSTASISVSPTVTTTYYVRAEGTTSPCAGTVSDNSVSVTVTVNQPSSAATAVTASSTTICNGTAITLSETGGTLGTGATWEWYSDNAYTNHIGSGNGLSVSPAATATYYVRAEGTASPCTVNVGNNAKSVTVTVRQPSVAATAVNASSTAICRGTNTTLTQTGGSLGTGAGWKWYSDNTFTTLVGTGSGATASLTVSPTVTTTYYLRAEGTTSPCTATISDNTINVTVTVTIAPNAGTITGTNTICPNGTTTFVSNGDAGGIWVSGTPAVATVNASTGVITPGSVGSSLISYTVTGYGGCADATASRTVNVSGTVVTPSVSIATFSTTICASSTVTVTATPTNGGAAPTYNFKVNGTSVQNTTSATYTTTTIPNGGVVTVEMTPNNPCQTASLVSSNSLTFNYSTGGAGVNVWTGNVSTNFSTAGNWCSGSVPTNGSSIVVQTAGRYPVLSTSGTYNDISLSTGTTLGLGTGSLTIIGTISGSGLLVGSSAGSLTINSNKANTLNFTAADTIIGTLNLSGTGKVTLGNGLGINTLLSLNNAAAVLDLNNNHLTLKSTSLASTAEVGAVSQGATIINGKVTVERFIPKELRNYRDLGASVANAGSVFSNWQESGNAGNTVNNGFFITGTAAKGTPYSPGKLFEPVSGLDYTLAGAPSMYTYNGTTWPAVTNTKTTLLNPFQGYRAIVRGARNFNMGTNPNTMPTATTVRTTGDLVTGDVAITTAGTTVSDNGSLNTSSVKLTTGAQAYSLIANPYACPVQWSKILGHSNIYNSYWYLDPTYQDPSTGYQRYITVQYTVASGLIVTPNPKVGGSFNDVTFDYIQAGQAIQVNNYGATGTPSISFREADKIVGGAHNDVFGLTTPSLMSIELYKNNTLADAAVASFNNNFTTAIGTEDAAKMLNSSENISITESNNDLSIDGLPLPTAGDVIPVRLGQLTANTTYQLKADISNFTTTGVQAYVRDNMLNTEVPAGSMISFTPTSVDISSYKDRFTVVFKAGSALGVKFTTVKAEQTGKDINVSWTTANETNMSTYEVEKSTNGKDFVKATSQSAKNADAATYNWLDMQAVNGANYYRIKAIEKGGKSSYSNVVVVNISKGRDQIAVYPNPITEKTFNLQLMNVAGGKYTVTLVNNLGQILVATTIKHTTGTSTETVRMDKVLPSGIYTLVVKSNEGAQIYQTELLAK